MKSALGFPLRSGEIALIDFGDAHLIQLGWTFRGATGNKFVLRCGMFRADKYSGVRALHRAIMSAPPGTIVDHINGDRLDNRRSNLRIATASQNSRNMPATQSNSPTNLSGVIWNAQRHKWQASIRVNGKLHHLGLFADLVDAKRARAEAEVALWGVEPRRRRALEAATKRTLPEQGV
jgi:hypothetical protein